MVTFRTRLSKISKNEGSKLEEEGNATTESIELTELSNNMKGYVLGGSSIGGALNPRLQRKKTLMKKNNSNL